MINYKMSYKLFDAYAFKRDSKGRIIKRYSKKEILQKLNEDMGVLGIITEYTVE